MRLTRFHLRLLQRAVFLSMVALTALPTTARAGENPLTRIKAGAELEDRIDLPLVFYDRTGFVRVQVNDKPLTFLVDSASLTVVNLDRLDLPTVGTSYQKTTTTTGATNLRWKLVQADRLAVGGKNLMRLRVLAKSLKELEQAFGREVDGILGNDVLMRWDSVKIDYRNGRLILEGDCSDRPVYPVAARQ